MVAGSWRRRLNFLLSFRRLPTSDHHNFYSSQVYESWATKGRNNTHLLLSTKIFIIVHNQNPERKEQPCSRPKTVGLFRRMLFLESKVEKHLARHFSPA